MLIKTIEVGHIGTNCYIVTDGETLECAVIDPGDESNTILDYLESNNLRCRHIFITHGHFDHTLAAAAVKGATGAEIYISEADIPLACEMNRELKPSDFRRYGDGDVVEVGNLKFEVIATPGHTPGGVTLKCGEALFTGDTLFKDSCGRTDLPGGNMDTQLVSLRVLAALPGDFEVYPGHMDSTTLERERRFNYYMKYARGDK